MKCPQCLEVLPADYSAAYCPFCGNYFPIKETAPRPPEPAPKRTWKYWLFYWLAFWLVFFGSPVLARILFFEGKVDGALGSLLIGWFLCGWALEKIFRGKLVLQVLFAMLVLAVYAFIAFAGFVYIIGGTGK